MNSEKKIVFIVEFLNKKNIIIDKKFFLILKIIYFIKRAIQAIVNRGPFVPEIYLDYVLLR
jgi:hypothetical protein